MSLILTGYKRNDPVQNKNGSAWIDFDIEKNKHIIELKSNDTIKNQTQQPQPQNQSQNEITFTKISVDKGLLSNPNGIIPQVRRVQWNRSDESH